MLESISTLESSLKNYMQRMHLIKKQNRNLGDFQRKMNLDL